MSRKLQSQPNKNVSWTAFDKAANILANKLRKHMRISNKKYVGIFPIPRGGYCLGVKLSHLLNIPLTTIFHQPNIIIVDEIVDEGKTLYFYTKNNFDSTITAVWHNRVDLDKETYGVKEPDFFVQYISNKDWITYPWEVKK